jgi:hypothetical protein
MALKSSSRTVQLALALIAALTLFAATPSAAQQPDDRVALDAPLPPKIVAGEVIVHFRPGITDEARDQSLAAVNGVFLRTLELQDAVIAKVPTGTEVSAAESLQVDPNVVSAEPNGILRTSELP